jgi:hypothetical protein
MDRLSRFFQPVRESYACGRATFLDDAEAVQRVPDSDRDNREGGHLLDGLCPGEKLFSRIKFSNHRPEVGEREVYSAGSYGDFGSPVGGKSSASSTMQVMTGYSFGMVTVLSFGRVTQHGLSDLLGAEYLQVVDNIIVYLA